MISFEEPRRIVAGNWKMNGSMAMLDLLQHVASGVSSGHRSALEIAIFPPATLLPLASTLCNGTSLKLGGQDCSEEENGAFTGDLSACHLSEAGASFVIVGHSERRSRYRESNESVRRKAEQALSAKVRPIICIGETEEERGAGRTLDVLSVQLLESLPQKGNVHDAVIAYEPVWAIGSGRTPSTADIEIVHSSMRSALIASTGDHGAGIKLLYGGSVKAANAGAIAKIPHVDGCLVGGASLNANEFLSICTSFIPLRDSNDT